MNTISGLRGREIINGRGIPAVEVDLFTELGRFTASAPSGVSVSSHEAVEIRDGGKRLMGKGVLSAVRNIDEIIAPALQGREAADQAGLDNMLIELDGTSQKSRLGGNAITAVSLAIAKAGAAASGLEPYAYLGGSAASRVTLLCPNMLSGSKTAGNSLDFEDYLIVPFGFATLCEALTAGVEIFHVLHKSLEKQYGLIPQITALAPPCKTSAEAMDFIMQAIAHAGYEGKVGLGIDVAADNFYDRTSGLYHLQKGPVDRSELIGHYQELTRAYPVVFWEDGLAEDDFEGFAEMTAAVPALIVGDDLFATNPARLAKGKTMGAANAMLLKVNQAGTVTEALAAGKAARDAGYTVVASVRSGETDDSIQADLAIAGQALLMKAGAPLRGEMVGKYNRLMWIERELGPAATFAGSLVAQQMAKR